MVSSVFSLLAQEPTTVEELKKQLDLDSLILTETFYFWTVVVMWLIHVGFMAYEAGVARRKNIMSTAMKNILTIAVVTPTFYYFGWYIYGCFEEGWPKSGHASPDAVPGLLRTDRALELRARPQPGEQPHGAPEPRLLPRVPPLLLDDRLDHVRVADRARAPLRLPAPDGRARARSSGSWTRPGAGAPAAG